MRTQYFLAYPYSMVAYVIGKLMRMGFFLVFAIAMFHKNKNIVGFNAGEIILFYAFMNFFDVFTQMVLLRGFSRVTAYVSNGQFDMMLTQPMNEILRLLARGFDMFDFITLPGAFLFLGIGFAKLGYMPSIHQILLGTLMTILSLISIFGVCLCVASLSFRSDKVENIWWSYRDLTYAARNPQEFFPTIIQIIFTYLVPIFVIITYPTRAFVGVLTIQNTVVAICCAVIFLKLGFIFWKKGLRNYSSVG